jgi:hypothetical protein
MMKKIDRVSRYTELELKKGKKYVVDKYVFRSAFLVMILFFLIIWITSGYSLFKQNVHLKCDLIGELPPMVEIAPQGCENPLYHEYQYKGKVNVPDEVFRMKYLPVGYEINKPPVTITFFPVIIIGVLLLALLYNHIKNNVMRVRR